MGKNPWPGSSGFEARTQENEVVAKDGPAKKSGELIFVVDRGGAGVASAQCLISPPGRASATFVHPRVYWTHELAGLHFSTGAFHPVARRDRPADPRRRLPT